jgi:hypothetical protein
VESLRNLLAMFVFDIRHIFVTLFTPKGLVVTLIYKEFQRPRTLHFAAEYIYGFYMVLRTKGDYFRAQD